MSKSAYPPVASHLDDPKDAVTDGRRKMDWALQHMPILQSLREEFEANQPLDGETVGMAMHVSGWRCTSKPKRPIWSNY
jgi:adenosylhomocysteinase